MTDSSDGPYKHPGIVRPTVRPHWQHRRMLIDRVWNSPSKCPSMRNTWTDKICLHRSSSKVSVILSACITKTDKRTDTAKHPSALIRRRIWEAFQYQALWRTTSTTVRPDGHVNGCSPFICPSGRTASHVRLSGSVIMTDDGHMDGLNPPTNRRMTDRWADWVRQRYPSFQHTRRTWRTPGAKRK